MKQCVLVVLLCLGVIISGYAEDEAAKTVALDGGNFALNVSVPENRAKKIEWLYAGVSDVVAGLYSCYSPVDLSDLVPMVNFLVDNNALASLDELVNLCKGVDVRRREYNGLSATSVLSKDCDGDLEAAYWPNAGLYKPLVAAYGDLGDFCGLFIENLMDKQMTMPRIDNFYSQVGTYVLRTKRDGVYSVVNIVLADGYKVNGLINQDVNTAPENTRVWEIMNDNSVQEMVGVHTATNDMFLNTMVSNDVRGIFNRSYICMDVDVTDGILQMFNEGRGAPGYSVTSAIKLFPDSTLGKSLGAGSGYILGSVAGMADSSYWGVSVVVGATEAGHFDTKRSLASKCSIDGQLENAIHSNGVMFDGKIVTLDWIGHFLYGMIREETVFSAKTQDDLRANLQRLETGDKDEPEHLKFAADMGTGFHQEKIAANIDRRFEKTQTTKPEEAHKMVKDVLVKDWGVAESEIRCGNNCNKFGTDVVWCTYQDKRREFTFDDVANGVFDFCREIIDE